MQHLFFDIRSGETLIKDAEGEDFANREDAKAGALTSAREIMADSLVHRRRPDGRQFVIKDEQDNTVLVVPFEEAVPMD